MAHAADLSPRHCKNNVGRSGIPARLFANEIRVVIRLKYKPKCVFSFSARMADLHFRVEFF